MSGILFSIFASCESLMPFLSSSDNLLQDACIDFQKGVDNFRIAHKIMFDFGLGALPLISTA